MNISILTLLVQNLPIMNRFEHIEPEESVDSITYSQYRTFVVFVRILHDEDTVPNETYIEQRVQTVYLYRRSEATPRDNSQGGL